MSRPLNEPWCMNGSSIEDADGVVVSWDVAPDDGDRIAAYSQAFHDIEDPVAWREQVDELRSASAAYTLAALTESIDKRIAAFGRLFDAVIAFTGDVPKAGDALSWTLDQLRERLNTGRRHLT